MSQTRKVGWVLLMGAALLFVAEIPNALLFIGEHPVQDVLNPLYVPSNAVSAIGALLWLWALPAAVALRAGGPGRLGSAGTFLIFAVAAGVVVFSGTLSAVVFPYLTQHTLAELNSVRRG